jgi:hypothetical protein
MFILLSVLGLVWPAGVMALEMAQMRWAAGVLEEGFERYGLRLANKTLYRCEAQFEGSNCQTCRKHFKSTAFLNLHLARQHCPLYTPAAHILPPCSFLQCDPGQSPTPEQIEQRHKICLYFLEKEVVGEIERGFDFCLWVVARDRGAVGLAAVFGWIVGVGVLVGGRLLRGRIKIKRE